MQIFTPVFALMGQFVIFFVIIGALFGLFGDLKQKWQQVLFILIVIFFMIIFGTMAIVTFFRGLNGS